MSYRRRRGSRSITIDVDVNLDDFETEDLREELKSRNNEIDPPLCDDLMEAREHLMRGRISDAMSLIEKLIWPKWRSVEQCEKEFAKQKQTN